MNDGKNQKDSKLKNYGIGVIVLIIITYSFYYAFFKTTNEIGFLGFDKTGRQIFIQTLDTYSEPDINVDSDFSDHNILDRILIQEPMRTTIKFNIKSSSSNSYLSSADSFLSQPYDILLKQYKGNISTRENSEISPTELTQRLNEKGCKTIEDFLAGLGFIKIQIFENGSHKLTVELKGNKNVYWSGGE